MVKKEWDDDTFHDRVSDRRSLYFLLSDSISARTVALLLLYNSYIYCADGKFCITTMHMNYSLFTLRSSLNLSYPPEHYPCCFSTTIPYKKFPITTKHFIIGLHRTSLPNSHFPIPNFHFSIFNYPPFYPPKEHNSKKC